MGLVRSGDRGAARNAAHPNRRWSAEKESSSAIQRQTASVGQNLERARLRRTRQPFGRLCETAAALGLAVRLRGVRMACFSTVTLNWVLVGPTARRPTTQRLRTATCSRGASSSSLLAAARSHLHHRPSSPRAPASSTPCTRYPTSPARPAMAGRRWHPRPASHSRGRTTTCPSQLPSSGPRRPPAPRPSSRPARRSICPSTCPSRRISRGPTPTTSCGRARGQRRAGPIRKARQRTRPPTSCPYTPRTSTICVTCVGT